MVAEHGEEDLVNGGPGATTGGMDIPVEAPGQQPAAGGTPQAHEPVEPGAGMTIGPAATAAAPAAGPIYVMGQQGSGSQAAFNQFNFGTAIGEQPPQTTTTGTTTTTTTTTAATTATTTTPPPTTTTTTI